MVKVLVKRINQAVITTLLVAISSTVIAAQFATWEDYVWEIIEEPTYANWGASCVDEDPSVYEDCLDKSLVAYDQKLIKEWQLSKYVSREPNQTIINLPNHKDPIVLTDESVEDSEVLRSIYQLDHYDAKKGWLYLIRQVYETDNTVMVDLKSGFIQEFEGSYLNFSPSMKHAVTVTAEFPEEENIIIWQKDQYGRYQFDKEDSRNDVKFRQHLNFYNASKNEPVVVHQVKTEWITNESLLVDFYFKMNEGDTAVYRIRFNYIKPNPTSEWHIIIL